MMPGKHCPGGLSVFVGGLVQPAARLWLRLKSKHSLLLIMQVLFPVRPEYRVILTPEALQFVAHLARSAGSCAELAASGPVGNG